MVGLGPSTYFEKEESKKREQQSKKHNHDLLFDVLVTAIRNLKQSLANFYDVTSEEVDKITGIGKGKADE